MSMKAKPEQPTSEEMAQFRAELSRKIQRLVGESLEAWSSCENAACRRARRCASDKRECIAKWHASLPPLSPDEAEQRMNNSGEISRRASPACRSAERRTSRS